MSEVPNIEIKLFTDEILTCQSLGKRFKVAPKTVGFWMDNYGLPFVRIGSKRMTTAQAFEAWVKHRNPQAAVSSQRL